MVGASPMVDDLDTVRRLEDAGTSAIVMHSLFEEQISTEQRATIYHMEIYADAYAEARSYFPQPSDFKLGPDAYVEQVRKIKDAVAVPVIASLNGVTPGGWVDYAKKIEQAGADALELNIYYVATDPQETAQDVETRLLRTLKLVKQAVSLPVAVKLSQFYSSIPNICYQLDEAGADGLVVFNRFYQPDIDIENLQVEPKVHLSTSDELPLRLRWLAILSGRVKASLALTGGVHTATDAIKSIMTGADAIQIVSAILKNGPKVLTQIRDGMAEWMAKNEYASLRQMKGSMNLLRCPDQGAFERANYMRVLQSWTEPV
jgi:dihydroorotate dehydrogenase (fumarate)